MSVVVFLAGVLVGAALMASLIAWIYGDLTDHERER